MEKEELIQKLKDLKDLAETGTPTTKADTHRKADEALLEYIDDDEVKGLFENINKYYV